MSELHDYMFWKANLHSLTRSATDEEYPIICETVRKSRCGDDSDIRFFSVTWAFVTSSDRVHSDIKDNCDRIFIRDTYKDDCVIVYGCDQVLN